MKKQLKNAERRLALTFAGLLCKNVRSQKESGMGLLERIDRMNAVERSGVCHAHDYCDANQVLIDAFEEMTGGHYEHGDSVHESMTMDAYNLARKIGFAKLAVVDQGLDKLRDNGLADVADALEYHYAVGNHIDRSVFHREARRTLSQVCKEDNKAIIDDLIFRINYLKDELIEEGVRWIRLKGHLWVGIWADYLALYAETDNGLEAISEAGSDICYEDYMEAVDNTRLGGSPEYYQQRYDAFMEKVRSETYKVNGIPVRLDVDMPIDQFRSVYEKILSKEDYREASLLSSYANEEKYECSWDVSAYPPHIRDTVVKRFDFFTDDNGYTSEDRQHIRGLEVGEVYHLDGHKVKRTK